MAASSSARRMIEAGLRLLLGGLFAYAGWTKIGNPTQFADSVATFQLLPVGLIVPMALALPLFEIMAGFLVITGWQRRVGYLALMILTAGFCIALVAALVRGIPVNCGCFGGNEIASKPWFETIQDIVLFAIAMWLYRSSEAPGPSPKH